MVSKIKVYVHMILSQKDTSNTNHRRGASSAGSWSPPPEGLLMVNVDAAMFETSRCMGAGIVVRNHEGEFVGPALSVF